MHPTDCSALELGEWVHNVAALFHFVGKELMLALVFQNPDTISGRPITLLLCVHTLFFLYVSVLWSVKVRDVR